MARPVILTVDDNIEVLRSVERDLRSQYGSVYRVLKAESGVAGLALLDELRRRGEHAALLLADQRMPEMTGVEMLEKAMAIYPSAKRALLTAYADTDAAIKAINDVRIDYYLLKPWNPPEEKLFPVLDDLLADWQAAFRPPFEGIRVVGNRWTSSCHDTKEFLARNNIPYLWLDPETSEEARGLLSTGDGPARRLPALFFSDGEVLEAPTNIEIADKVGLQTTADRSVYDLTIIGAGPAGLAAAVYGASEGLKTIVVERSAPGGQAGMSSRIENYLGFPAGLSGGDLARRAVAQAKRFGVEILAAQEAVEIDTRGPARTVTLGDRSEFGTRAMLICTGVSYRLLDAPGVKELTGAGIYYGAAMTEGESVRGSEVFIVGGANSAGQAAMYFSRFASKVTLLVRGESLSATMSQYLIEQIGSTSNIEVLARTTVTKATGSDRLKSLTLSHDGQEREVATTALFVMIGAVPATAWLGDGILKDDHGFIVAGPEIIGDPVGSTLWKLDRQPFLLETSVPGIFVAGDVRTGSLKRVASAVGEGAAAVMFIHKYLNSI
ncbi:MAG: response regulator [Spirochaetales bacterium]|nr:MAG: response regulator [Spirochaetales bacterium]